MGTPKAGRISDLFMDGLQIGGLQDMTLELSRSTFDTTNKESAGWDEFINGQGSMTLSGTCVYEEDDDGQDSFLEALLGTDEHTFRVRPHGALALSDEWELFGFPTSANIDSPNKDALSFPFTIQLSGAPARTTQGSLFAGTFQLEAESGAEQLTESMTINATTLQPKWMYRGGSASRALWVAAVGDNLTKTVPATEDDDVQHGRPAPFTDGTDGVRFSGSGTRYSTPSKDAYEWAGSGGDEDFVLEMVVRVNDFTDTDVLIGKRAAGTTGWSVASDGADQLSLVIYDTIAGSATIASPVMVADTWYHLIWFVDKSGSGVCYSNAVVGGAAVVSGLGTGDTDVATFNIGGQDGATSGQGAQATLAYAAAWGALNWLDTHLQASLAQERLAMISGYFATSADGTAYPTTVSADVSYQWNQTNARSKVLLHKMGAGYPRLCSWGATWGSPEGAPLKGFYLEAATTNDVDHSTDPKTGGVWTETRATFAVEAGVSNPFQAAEVVTQSVAPTGTASDTHGVHVGMGATSSQSVSVFVKRNGNKSTGIVKVGFDNLLSDANGVAFDLRDGSVISTGASASNPNAEYYGDGWWRLDLESGGTSSDGFYIAPASSGGLLTYADPTPGEVAFYFCAPMRATTPANNLAPTYVPYTGTGGSLARTADEVRYTMDDGNMPSAEVAFTVNFDMAKSQVVSASANILALSDGISAASSISMFQSGSEFAQAAVVSSEGANSVVTASATMRDSGQLYKGRLRLDGLDLVLEDITTVDSASTTLAFAGPNDIDSLAIGMSASGAVTSYLSALLNKIEIYSTDIGTGI